MKNLFLICDLLSAAAAAAAARRQMVDNLSDENLICSARRRFRIGLKNLESKKIYFTLDALQRVTLQLASWVVVLVKLLVVVWLHYHNKIN